MAQDSKKLAPLVLITVSGNDQPGITSQITSILAQGEARIIDIGQAVIHNLLSLSILFDLQEGAAGSNDHQSVIKDLLFKAAELGLKLEFRVIERRATEGKNNPATGSDIPFDLKSNIYRYALTLISDQITAQALHQVTSIVAKYDLNIDIIERLSEQNFSCVEILASCNHELDRSSLKKELLTIARRQGVDIGLQAEGLYRRAKRMVVLDMDSTLIQSEVIDEFARERGVFSEVAAITEEAMRGKIPFDESLALRCAKLKGLTHDEIDRVFKRIKLTAGAEDLVRVLKSLGYKIAIISGGFSLIADRLRDRLGIDYAYANQLEFEGGKATGKVIPPIVNAQRKADLLDVIAQQERIHRDQVIAVGDGANDLLMLERAGLGIAFNAKPVVREKADLSINQKNLKNILYLLGISGRDVAEVLG